MAFVFNYSSVYKQKVSRRNTQTSAAWVMLEETGEPEARLNYCNVVPPSQAEVGRLAGRRQQNAHVIENSLSSANQYMSVFRGTK